MPQIRGFSIIGAVAKKNVIEIIHINEKLQFINTVNGDRSKTVKS